jgi:hypothetical protein
MGYEQLSLGLARLIVAPKGESLALAHQLTERVGQGDRIYYLHDLSITAIMSWQMFSITK